MLKIIANYGLSTEWDGPAFEETEIPLDGPLRLMAHEVAWGRFDDLECFCQTHGLPYVRTCDGFNGSWSAQKAIFDGTSNPRSYLVSQEGDILLPRSIFATFGSLAEIAAYYDEDAVTIPPLSIVDTGDA